MWLLLAFIGHLLNAFVFITDKAFVEKIFPNPKALAFIAGASGVFTFVLIPWFLKPAPLLVLAAAIGAGAIIVPALFLFFTALSRDELSRVVPAIGSLTPLFTFGLSFFILGERLGDRFLAAFILLALGGILIAVRSFSSLFLRRYYSLFLLEILVGFLFALGFVLQKFAFTMTDDFSAFLWSRVGAFHAALPLLLFVSVRKGFKFSSIRSGQKWRRGVLYIVSRIFAGVSPLMIVFAISFGSATLVNALQGVQYAFLYILAIFFASRFPDIFKEELRRDVLLQKAAATVLIIIGLALLV